MKAYYTCPKCHTKLACSCNSCASSIKEGEIIAEWSKDGNLVFCRACKSYFEPSDSYVAD